VDGVGLGDRRKMASVEAVPASTSIVVPCRMTPSIIAATSEARIPTTA
jgi:hypothetical protein